MSHTVKEALGSDRVEAAVIVALDQKWQPVAGTEKTLSVDTICLAVGLNPTTALARMAGCKMAYVPALGGNVPAHDENQQTSVPGLYVAGDVAGIEEASSAIVEGRLAGLAAARSLGYLEESEFEAARQENLAAMAGLRSGPFGDKRRLGKEAMMAALEG